MKNLLIAILLFTCFDLSAQWPKVFGEYTFDMIGRSLLESNDHGYFFSGGEKLSTYSNLSGYIIKTDINGYVLWKRYIVDPAEINIVGMSQTSDGGLFVSGQKLVNYDGNSDGFYMKFSACGEKEWCKVVAIPGSSACLDNIKLNDGSFIIHSGHYKYNEDRIWLYKVDSLGSLLWTKTLEPDTAYFGEIGYHMRMVNDSSLLISSFAATLRDPGSPLAWESPFWVMLSIDGDQIWDTPWFTSSHIEGDIGNTRTDKAGNYYSVGSYGLGPGQRVCYYKLNSTGQKLKYQIMSYIGDASGGRTIEFFDDSTLFIGAGYSINGVGYSLVLKSDTVGNNIITKNIPLFGAAPNYSLVTFDHKIVALGERYQTSGNPNWETVLFKFNQDLEYDSIYTMPRAYDSLCNHPVVPEITYDFDCEIVSLEEREPIESFSQITIYPNPASDFVNFKLPERIVDNTKSNGFSIQTTFYTLEGEKRIDLIDLSGRVVASYTWSDRKDLISMDISNLSPGMYLATLNWHNKMMASGKLIVRH